MEKGTYKMAKARGVAGEFLTAYKRLMQYLDDEQCAKIHEWFTTAAKPLRDAHSIWVHRRGNRMAQALGELIDLQEDARYTWNLKTRNWYNIERVAALRAVERATERLRDILDNAEEEESDDESPSETGRE